MLRLAKSLTGYKLGASDGEIGKVEGFYFDDQSWCVRYLVVDTGAWLGGREVLIARECLGSASASDLFIIANLTRSQIENGPSPDSARPVSRQFEAEYYPSCGWPEYSRRADSSGTVPPPTPQLLTPPSEHDPHLRSAWTVTGHAIEAQDGAIGHVKDFVVDDESWTIRYLVVDTQNWWPGRKVLISTLWIDRISWAESKVVLHLTREAIKRSPEYSVEALISREYETHLHGHYERSGYWTRDVPVAVARPKGAGSS